MVLEPSKCMLGGPGPAMAVLQLCDRPAQSHVAFPASWLCSGRDPVAESNHLQPAGSLLWHCFKGRSTLIGLLPGRHSVDELGKELEREDFMQSLVTSVPGAS